MNPTILSSAIGTLGSSTFGIAIDLREGKQWIQISCEPGKGWAPLEGPRPLQVMGTVKAVFLDLNFYQNKDLKSKLTMHLLIYLFF